MYKNILITLLLALNISSAFAQDSTDVSFSFKDYEFRFVSQDHYYPIYLADPLAPRFEAAVQSVKYSDFHFEDNVNSDGTYGSKVYINTGSKVTLFGISPKDRPDLGIGFEIGASIPLYMEAAGFDFMAVDGIFHFAITGKPTHYLSFRLAKHHICTHRGDEYSKGSVKTPVDFDPNDLTLYVRDDYHIALAYEPFAHLIHEKFDFFRIYGDFIFFSPGVDFLGDRLNKPERYAYLAYQGGAELEYYFPKQVFGGVYSAVNVSAYQSNGFSPNISIMAGYILPQQKNRKRVRIGLQYYDGRGVLNEFYNRHEKYTGFFFATDI